MSGDFSNDDPFGSALSAARYYWSLGLEPIPFSSFRQDPRWRWKPPVQWTAQDIKREFAAIENVGIALGERSGNLIDVDLIWAEASLIGMATMENLPPFGRRTVRFGHRLAIGRLPNGVVRFKIPDEAAHLFNSEHLTILELRGNRHQVMVPPSMHPSGERLEWELEFDEVPEIDGDQLIRDAGLTAFLAVVARVYPKTPSHRSDVCLALAGTLLRAGYHPNCADIYIEKLAWVGGDEEFDRRDNTSNEALFRHWARDGIGSVSTLCNLLGIEPMVEAFQGWLSSGFEGGSGDGSG